MSFFEWAICENLNSVSIYSFYSIIQYSFLFFFRLCFTSLYLHLPVLGVISPDQAQSRQIKFFSIHFSKDFGTPHSRLFSKAIVVFNLFSPFFCNIFLTDSVCSFSMLFHVQDWFSFLLSFWSAHFSFQVSVGVDFTSPVSLLRVSLWAVSVLFIAIFDNQGVRSAAVYQIRDSIITLTVK